MDGFARSEQRRGDQGAAGPERQAPSAEDAGPLLLLGGAAGSGRWAADRCRGLPPPPASAGTGGGALCSALIQIRARTPSPPPLGAPAPQNWQQRRDPQQSHQRRRGGRKAPGRWSLARGSARPRGGWGRRSTQLRSSSFAPGIWPARDAMLPAGRLQWSEAGGGGGSIGEPRPRPRPRPRRAHFQQGSPLFFPLCLLSYPDVKLFPHGLFLALVTVSTVFQLHPKTLSRIKYSYFFFFFWYPNSEECPSNMQIKIYV